MILKSMERKERMTETELNKMLKNQKDTKMTDRIEWYEFAPAKDYFLVKTIPNESEKKTESGIVISVSESVVEDRPRQGVVVSVGPDCPYEIGDFLFFQKTAGYDMKNIKTDELDQYYVLYHPDAVLGKRVKDVRKNCYNRNGGCISFRQFLR